MNNNHQPFGEAWKESVSKLSKPLIIDLFGNIGKEKVELRMAIDIALQFLENGDTTACKAVLKDAKANDNR